MADLFDEKPRAADYPRGIPTVSFSFRSPAGPRSSKAGVTISYEGQYPLEYQSRAVWPKSDNFESAVRSGILDAIVVNGVPTIGGIFRLDGVEFDAVHSSEYSFRVAAREAARSLLCILRKQ